MKGDKLHDGSLEQRLQQAAEHFEMQPSDKVWERIEGALPAKGDKKFFIGRWIAAAAVLLLLCGLGWFFLNNHSTTQKNKGLSSPIAVEKEKSGTSQSSPKGGSVTAVSDPTGHAEKQKTIAQNAQGKPEQKTAGKNPEPVALRARSSHVKKEVRMSAGGNSPLLLNSQNNTLSFLQNINKLQGEEGNNTGNQTTAVQYSNRIIQLMLKEIEPASSPLLAGNNKKKHKDKLSFGVFFTPGVSYRTLKINNPASSMRYASPSINTLRPNSMNVQEALPVARINREHKSLQQKQNWGWNSGVRVALHLSEKWIMQTGLSLRKTSYEITAYKQQPGFVYNNGSSAVATPPFANSTFASYADRYANDNKVYNLDNHYLSTELPLLVGRRFGNPDRFSVTVLAGAGLTYLLHSDAVMYAPRSQRYFSDQDYLQKLNSSLIFEADMEVPLSRHLEFSIGPALQYQLFTSYKDYNPVKEFPYLIGVKTAFHFK